MGVPLEPLLDTSGLCIDDLVSSDDEEIQASHQRLRSRYNNIVGGSDEVLTVEVKVPGRLGGLVRLISST